MTTTPTPTPLALAFAWGIFLTLWLFVVRIGWLQPRRILFIGIAGSLLWTAVLVALIVRAML